MNIEDKLKSVSNINDDINYLKGEYKDIKLWGDCPDGDVNFFKLAKWLHDNKHVVDHIISTVEKLESIK